MAPPTRPSIDDQDIWALLTVVLGQALLIGGFLFWAFSQPEHSTGYACGGFDCMSDPQSGALLAGVIVGVPLLAVSTVVAMISATRLVGGTEESGVAAGFFGWILGWMVTGCGGLALLAFVKLR